MAADGLEQVRFFVEPEGPPRELHPIASGTALVRSVRCPRKVAANRCTTLSRRGCYDSGRRTARKDARRTS